MIDIIIPMWNQWEKTVACLRSIQEFTDPKVARVLLINNGSEAGDWVHVNGCVNETAMACLDAGTDMVEVEIVDLRENLGFVKGTNVGIAMSTNDVVLLNNDTEVCEDWLTDLAAGVDHGYDIIGPLAQAGIESWQSLDNVQASFPATLPTAGYHYLGVDRMVAFFCTYITRKVIQEIGYLSEAYGVGFADDDDFCFRARKAGFKIGLATGTVIFHHHRTTFRTIYGDHYKEMQEANRKIFHERSRTEPRLRSRGP